MHCPEGCTTGTLGCLCLGILLIAIIFIIARVILQLCKNSARTAERQYMMQRIGVALKLCSEPVQPWIENGMVQPIGGETVPGGSANSLPDDLF